MAFKNVNCLTLSSVAALALLTTATVQAIPLDNPTISGSPSTTYVVDTNDNTLLVEDTMNTALSAVLTGSAANPGGNVELGKLASEPATVLSGTLDGSAFTASSLTLDDWTANDNALAETYITAAATAISANLTTAELALATGVFLTDAYKRVSDPNIGYVDLENDVVKIGLQGFDDATPLLEQLFPIFTGSLPGGLQVSEVVKVTLDGNTQYLYGFSATPTERATVDGSYSGNYEVAFAAAAAAVPTPATLALVAIGLLGLYSRKTLNKINS